MLARRIHGPAELFLGLRLLVDLSLLVLLLGGGPGPCFAVEGRALLDVRQLFAGGLAMV